MDELIECGYMRKTQNRIKGKFDAVDHEVSFVPFTENPYTDKPLTENTEQQSKDLTKNRDNKGNTPDTSKAGDEFFLEDILHEYGLTYCKEAVETLDIINAKGCTRRAYTGRLKLSEWLHCEALMSSVDFFDFEYFVWWMETRSSSFSKTPSLPNMLCDFDKSGTDFEQFYNSTFSQEWE